MFADQFCINRVSLEEVLSLFTDCVQDFPPAEIADGAPKATEQLPHAPVLVSAPASTLPSADPNSEPPVSGKVYVMPGDGHQASLQDVIMAQQANKPAHLVTTKPRKVTYHFLHMHATIHISGVGFDLIITSFGSQ